MQVGVHAHVLLPPRTQIQEGSMNYTLRNLLVATGLMVVGIVLVITFIRGERQDITRGQQLVKVYVAAKDIPEGTPASELESGGFLDTKDMARDAAPPQAIGNLSTVEGLVSNEVVHLGEVVTVQAFDREAGLKPTAQVKGTDRLLTLPIKPNSDVAGQIRPGDHVDLTAALHAEGSQSVRRVILARDIEIMETPESLRPDTGDEADPQAPDAEGDMKLYEIKATDEEAQYILFGLSTADDYGVQMLLRGSSGDTQSKTPPIASIDPKVD
jgi:pilus assembly protein CpaB